jgi:hypothetical protein
MEKNQKIALDFFKSGANSKIQEQFAEHLFLKDLLLEAASQNEEVAILRSDYDNFGYDLVLERIKGHVLQKVQLKAYSGKTRHWNVHLSIVETGKIVLIWLQLDEDGIIKPQYNILSKSRVRSKKMSKIVVVKDRKGKLKLKPQKEKINKGDFEKIEPGKMLEKIFFD